MENKEAMIQEILEMFTKTDPSGENYLSTRNLFDWHVEQTNTPADKRDFPIEVIDAAVAEVMSKAAA